MICRICKKEIPDGSIYCMFCGYQIVREPKERRPNGTGYIRKIGGKWQAIVTVYDPHRRTISKRFKYKAEAINAVGQLRQELLERVPQKRAAATVEDLYQIWLEASAPKLTKPTQTAYRIAWERIRPLKDRRIDSIGLKDLQALVAGLPYYPAKDVKSLLSHIYKRACAEQDVTANLSAFIELPKVEEKEAEPFTADEVRRMWSAWESGDDFVGYLLIMIYTGMMPGELMKCEKSMIDLERQQINGAGLKTKERRTKPILLPSAILPIVRHYIESVAGDKLLRPVKDKFYDKFHACLKRIGVRDLTPYSCRHTTATILALDDGVAPMLITKALRQKQPLITERYKHADEHQILSALERIDLKPPVTHPTTYKNAGKPDNLGLPASHTVPAKGVGWGDWREGSNPSFSAKDRE